MNLLKTMKQPRRISRLMDQMHYVGATEKAGVHLCRMRLPRASANNLSRSGYSGSRVL
jgi:hypothetical protein